MGVFANRIDHPLEVPIERPKQADMARKYLTISRRWLRATYGCDGVNSDYYAVDMEGCGAVQFFKGATSLKMLPQLGHSNDRVSFPSAIGVAPRGPLLTSHAEHWAQQS